MKQQYLNALNDKAYFLRIIVIANEKDKNDKLAIDEIKKLAWELLNLCEDIEQKGEN